MFCPKCGTELKEDAKFCKKCGTRVENIMNDNSNNVTPNNSVQGSTIPQGNFQNQQILGSQQQRKKSKIIPLAIGIILVIVLGIGIVSVIETEEDSKYIDFVKEGNPEAYPDITYKNAFESFFGNPKWKYFKADSGEDVVEFSGDCTYQDTEVTATIQFILNYDDDTFETGAFDMNGVPQNQLMTYAIITKVFDEYQSGKEDHNLGELQTDLNQTNNSDQPVDNNSDDDIQESNTYEEDNLTSTITYTDWINTYSRSSGPFCCINIWNADEDKITFALAIGCSGDASYVDMRDCEAYFIDEGYTYAVYSDNYYGYELDFRVMEDGSLDVTESGTNPYDLALGGNYEVDSVADYDICSYVFPNSDYIELQDYDFDGLTATESKIARNEIYARYGRKFKDEMLQAYFDTCPWYFGYIEPEDFTEDMLNETERKNVQLISNYEVLMGYK